MKATATEKIIYEMLTENTGIHFLDSGGDNNRMWQQNQAKTLQDFINEPEERIEVDFYEMNGIQDYYINRTVSVFHYLSMLEFDDICKKFNKINLRADNWDGSELEAVYGCSKEAIEYLQGIGTVFGDTTNTYNYASDLSQILQYTSVTINDDYYIILQIHGGADARGGYTDARLFKLADNEYQIHEYLMDYEPSEEILDGIKEGYYTNIYNYDTDKKLTKKQISDLLK